LQSSFFTIESTTGGDGLVGYDGDAGEVCGCDDGGRIEEQRLPCFDGETGGSGGLHGVDGGDADDGDVEAHVLIGFGYFDDGEVAAESGFFPDGFTGEGFTGKIECAKERAGAGDGGVGAFHRFDGDAGLSGDDDSLAEVVGGDGLGYGAAVEDVLLLFFVGRAAGEDA